jgi:para-nitrobenzyl esterase
MAADTAASAASETGVEISAGKLRGIEQNGVKIFKGVPYGAPVSGADRFRAPKPAPVWAGVRDALEYGPSAPQGTSLAPEPARPEGGSLQGDGSTFAEDCLVLNVWTPSYEGKRPVMVWIHGGGFRTGSGSARLYDGATLAKREDVVVVTINHRLGVFGYLDLGAWSGDDADSASAGMADCILALRWVKENAAAFGGDPGNVTIFGESGGGRKTSVLMAMPAAQGLFHRCVVQSGSALRMDTKAVGQERAEKLFAALGLKPGAIEKLRALPAEAILVAGNEAMRTTGQFRPTAGAPSLPAHPFDPAAPALSAAIPMMIGTNRTEASFALARDRRVLEIDEAGVLKRLERLVPEKKAGAVLAAYKRLYPDAKPCDVLFMAATDRGYFLDATIQAGRKADQGGAPAFFYQFYWEQKLPNGSTHCPHGSEIAFVFGNIQSRSESAARLSAQMSAAWAAFARTGDPSTAALAWPRYDPAARPTMMWKPAPAIENDPRREQRNLMLAFGSQQYGDREIAPM